jgi:hypothetical protein
MLVKNVVYEAKLKKINVSYSNISGKALAKIIFKAKLLDDNMLLIDCLKLFNEYHLSIGFIVKSLIKNIQDGYTIPLEYWNSIIANQNLDKTVNGELLLANRFELMKAMVNSLTDPQIQEIFEKPEEYSLLIENIEFFRTKQIMFKEKNRNEIERAFRGPAAKITSALLRNNEKPHILYKLHSEMIKQTDSKSPPPPEKPNNIRSVQ